MKLTLDILEVDDYSGVIIFKRQDALHKDTNFPAKKLGEIILYVPDTEKDKHILSKFITG